MTLIYQPISRTFGQRDGCLTPSAFNDDKHTQTTEIPRSKSNILLQQSSELDSRHEILSPPLSPYQKSSESHSAANGIVAKASVYLPSESPFKLENYRSYSLTLRPWSSLDSHYKERQLSFLRRYNVSGKESITHPAKSSEKRERRKRRATSGSDSDSDSPEKMRTRRDMKESSVQVEKDSDSESIVSSPKRRRVKKEPSYVGSPLAIQQAALIDESIPDYSPDAQTTLPNNNTRALKIEWKGQPMDLKSDPHLEKLHPAEAVLASTLRLPCNVYLDSKRRFFFEKVHRMREGKPFRRTDAQKACRIDVNKASRLFAAFEKVGWLDDKHFSHYL